METEPEVSPKGTLIAIGYLVLTVLLIFLVVIVIGICTGHSSLFEGKPGANHYPEPGSLRLIPPAVMQAEAGAPSRTIRELPGDLTAGEHAFIVHRGYCFKPSCPVNAFPPHKPGFEPEVITHYYPATHFL